MQDTTDPPIKAVVIVPHRNGHNGSFFEAESKIGRVTVSLNGNVWQEKSQPEGGVTVILWDIRHKRKGWRAYGARFYRPSDEQLFNKQGESMRTLIKEEKDVRCK
ncbi:hypothetical protein A2524_04410 [Candidatus Wolfebacteria bacterium RIFOXYD12_FULL_48_21]|uniref:Uncharacterized protein n=1 Tax=Candidatus Wolfebacteria bacterium RIFOXYD1_FULL_48_65 TaxID=1802561 RepID=A0A1F8E3J1_9BACT|nr:MAG: hypothetical protein A2610_03490 [Candidatus Wolfebacteria bacterium RIFOXYD1_FULL_48_65]OGM95287.1 MAG: hypothetical protein A2524_04410 [Candidatus Wolfebacteria bacterium RIFOXYD12_FULL_48_21]OGM96856.1 MAG: hypothetical protein A2532_01770 [Candidatus Wolfebacteria bacterium RIFOXYD2_FULL_48_11]